MKLILKITLLAVCVVSFCGCQESKTSTKLLSVDFKKDKPLRYKFVSQRNIELTLASDKPSQKKSSNEKLEMVISYELMDVDIYGDSKIKATCESISASRSSFSKRKTSKPDPIETIRGKSWVFKVNPLGQIQDYEELNKLLQDVGDQAIQEQGKRKIKDEDLIWDFVATQWFLWDAVSSIEKPLEGVKPGQSWSSFLSIPFSQLLPYERAVTYTCVKPQNRDSKDHIAIESVFSLAPQEKDEQGKIIAKLENLPNPYKTGFQQRGMFGFLRGYKVTGLNGNGKLVYDSKNARLLSDQQNYNAKMLAGFLFPLGDSLPQLNLEQSITIQLLDNK